MLLPLIALIVFAVLALLYDGGYWGKDAAYHTVAAALGNCSASKALVWASFGALGVAFIMYIRAAWFLSITSWKAPSRV